MRGVGEKAETIFFHLYYLQRHYIWYQVQILVPDTKNVASREDKNYA